MPNGGPFIPEDTGISYEEYMGQRTAPVPGGFVPEIGRTQTRDVTLLPVIPKRQPTPAPSPLAPPIPPRPPAKRAPGLPYTRVPGLYEPQFVSPEYEPSRLEEMARSYEGLQARTPLLGQLLGATFGTPSMYGPLRGYQPVQAEKEKVAQQQIQEEARRALGAREVVEREQRRAAEAEAELKNWLEKQKVRASYEERQAARDWNRKLKLYDIKKEDVEEAFRKSASPIDAATKLTIAKVKEEGIPEGETFDSMLTKTLNDVVIPMYQSQGLIGKTKTKGAISKPTKRVAPALTTRDQEALDWARANPSDPRATQIMQRLGM